MQLARAFLKERAGGACSDHRQQRRSRKADAVRQGGNGDAHPGSTGNEACIIGLDVLRARGGAFRCASEEQRHMVSQLRVRSSRGYIDAGRARRVGYHNFDNAAARNCRGGDKAKIQNEFNFVFWHEEAWRAPSELRPLIGKKATRNFLRVPRIDRSSSRASGAECEPAELEARGGLFGGFFDEVNGKTTHFLAGLFLENFKAVNDRSNGADDVMADPRTEEGGEIEGIESKHGHPSISKNVFSKNVFATFKTQAECSGIYVGRRGKPSQLYRGDWAGARI